MVSFQLVATDPSGATRTVTTEAQWLSASPNVAFVSGGQAICRVPGLATITAHYMSASASTQLSCVSSERQITLFYVSPGGELRPVPVQTKLQLTAYVRFSDSPADRDVSRDTTWSSSDPGVVSVEMRGASVIVTAVGRGTATITATYSGRTAKTIIPVL